VAVTLPTSEALTETVHWHAEFVVFRLFSEKGEKLKTLDFKTGAGTYTVSTKKGSYNSTGDRVETLGINMYMMFVLSLVSQSSNAVELCACI